MSKYLPKAIQDLIEELEKLPGVGPKSAARMAYFFLRAPEDYSKRMSDVFNKLHEGTVMCDKCFNVAESNPCAICEDLRRNAKLLCVVEEPLDVIAFEKSGGFEGLYFVLGGVISPAEGVGPDEIRIEDLVNRIKLELTQLEKDKQIELVLATNPSMEGEATAVYISERLVEAIPDLDEKVKITRLARGLPTGADLEYADSLTLRRALEGRTKF
jgi:recombination protein RecR